MVGDSGGRGEIKSLTVELWQRHCPCRAWEQVAETHRFPTMGTVLAWVSKSDTIPVPTGPAWQNLWVYLYPHSTLNTPETMEHILLHCDALGQKTVWSLTKALWHCKGLSWPDLTLGSLLGCGITDFCTDSGFRNEGANHLFTIIISESTYLIWKLCCEWCIQRESNNSARHSVPKIEYKWLQTINLRLRLDCLLTNKWCYSPKALCFTTIHCTWARTLLDEEHLPDNWHKSSEVLVGMGADRPPRHNC